MTIQVDVFSRFNWFGDRVVNNLKQRMRLNTLEAIKFYKKEIQKELTKTQGRPGYHSSPGQPPFRQEGELSTSMTIFITTDPGSGDVAGSLISDTEYAQILEEGGQAGNGYIAPRPAWIPVFERIQPQLLKILAR